VLGSIKSRVKGSLGKALQKKYAAKPLNLEPAHWQLEYDGDQLSYRGLPLASVAAQFGTPTHVVLEERLLANLADFQAPGCEVFLSYKTNPVPGVLKALHAEGAGAEVISEFEFWLALALGVPPALIIYNGPAKSDRSLEWAVEKDILAVHINHAEEAERLRAIARRLGRQVRVGLRITGSGWAEQFGLSIESGAALAFLRELLAIPEFKVTSLHCHRGAKIRTESDLTAHLDQVASFCRVAKAELGWTPEQVDVGGSLGIPTVRSLEARDVKFAWAFGIPALPPDPSLTLSPRAYSEIVVRRMRSEFAAMQAAEPRIIIEPGRSLTGNAQLLLSKVIDVKQADGLSYAILDAGSCHARIIADEFHQVFPLTRRVAEAERFYRLVGPICHTGDFIARAWRGGRLERGDFVAVMDSGAYFIADSASFSFPRAGVVMLRRDGALQALRGLETYEDMVRLDQL
jgi:diaminopimelate decarboxylase